MPTLHLRVYYGIVGKVKFIFQITQIKRKKILYKDINQQSLQELSATARLCLSPHYTTNLLYLSFLYEVVLTFNICINSSHVRSTGQKYNKI